MSATAIGNFVKQSGADGLALQITELVRAAGLVEESKEGGATRKAIVRVYTFDDFLLIVDRDTDGVKTEAAAELVASAARDTNTISPRTPRRYFLKGVGDRY